MATTTQTETSAITITDRTELNRVIREIGQLEREIDKFTAQMNEEARKATQRFRKMIDRRKQKLAERETAALQFAEDHQADLLAGTDGKTVELPAGEIQYRAGRDKVVIEDDEDVVIQRLRDAGHDDLVRVKVRIDKRACLRRAEIVDAIQGLAIETGPVSISIKPHAAV